MVIMGCTKSVIFVKIIIRDMQRSIIITPIKLSKITIIIIITIKTSSTSTKTTTTSTTITINSKYE